MRRTRFDKIEIFSGKYYKVRFELFKYLCHEEERKIHLELRDLTESLKGFYWGDHVNTGEAVFETIELAEQFKKIIEMEEFYWTEKTCKSKKSYEEVMDLVNDFGGTVHSIRNITSDLYTVIASFPSQDQLNFFNASYNLNKEDYENCQEIG